ncbi:glycosyltransferase involved in cell wall biosynthesis [Pontibacter ummariensis]|uniref:Glycosyltransferase involved in cell wall bisynthesis n=2 Tax=Pontibacter ummariensis TaxID=1610492 RepID=A0A239KHJ7_9BACT|nr:glycosyltransferase involved in cell wall biosynthesis [Pontibacter ummariensis]SNT17866.1 Glycosyltransferase involved in cell wall bisynthesis [Pontibacter ummariensis]
MTADTVGGVWNYSLELVRALAPFGTQVVLATMGAPLREEQREQIEDISNLTVHESDYKLEWMDDPWADLEKAGEWLLKLKDEVQPDVVHLNGMVHGNLDWGIPVVVVVHSCVMSWWRAVKGEDAPKEWDRYKERVTRGLQAADMVVAPTQAMLHQAQELYGPFKSSTVVYNGRGQYSFQFGKKEPFVFSMGRVWDEAKNIATLAHIAADLPWPVYIAGEDKHPATGKTMELENVHFLGQLSEKEVSDWLSRASIYALPAKYEPFGLTILEAAMSGCALVVGKTESLAEVWGNAAKYVDPNSADELRDTVADLIEDEFARNIMAMRAIKRSHGYTSDPMGQDYDHVYRQLMKASITA